MSDDTAFRCPRKRGSSNKSLLPVFTFAYNQPSTGNSPRKRFTTLDFWLIKYPRMAAQR
jgi:hypothetical protein